MIIDKPQLESIGRRICAYNKQDPEAAVPIGEKENGEMATMPAWMVESLFVNKMMVANQATKDELASLPSPMAPPEQPMVYTPYHDNNQN